MSSQRSLPQPGDVLAGKYRLERRIGEGGMGVVFEAMHVRIHQRVAIKMLLPEMIDVPDVVSRFEREARAAGKLRSDNTTRVLDVDVTPDGVPYMVMEFLEGNDLGHLLETKGRLAIADAVDYVLQACNAMAEAHFEGVVHRDLKPSNLFVTSKDQKLKVLDFGISKVENDKDARVTATQAVVGTPLYMSPEQVRSSKSVDGRSDIWSLGIILYELLAGRTPFEGSTTAAAVSICTEDPPPLSTFREDIPAPLEQAIRGALEKDLSRRLPNVQSLAAAIAPFGSGAIRISTTHEAPIIPVSQPSVPKMVSDPTLPHVAMERSNPRANITAAGWTTRSNPKTRRNVWLVGVVAGVAVGGSAIALVAMRNAKTSRPTADSIHAADSVVVVATSVASTKPIDTDVALPTTEASASQKAPPAHTTPRAGHPSATTTPTITTAAPHATPAPTRI